MTASATSVPRPIDSDELVRRFSPAEGWATVIAVVILPLAFAWSLDDAGWIPSLEGTTAYLPWLALVATLVGIGLAKAGLGRWKTDLVGSVIGGLVLPFVAGNVVLANQNLGLGFDAILARYEAAGNVARRVWDDLVVNGQPFTSQYGHYHMVFAGMVWAAGLLAANAVVGRRRPLDAVVVCGLLLLINEGITGNEQLPILVVFSIAAMTLLIRTHVLEEQLTWVRRRIGDPTSVSSLYIRGGATFVGVAVLGALLLTATASSAPLRSLWSDLPRHLADFVRVVQGLAPGGGVTRVPGDVLFGSSAVTNGLWSPDQNKVAFTAHVPANDTQRYKWRAGTYAHYNLFGWDWGTTHEINRSPKAPLLTGTGDDPLTDIARTPVRIEIDPQAYIDTSALSPQTINWIDRDGTVVGAGDLNRFTTVKVSGNGPYTLEALIPNLGDATGGLTENRLRVAGRNYPTDVTSVYLQVPPNATGPNAEAVLATVEAQFGGKAAAEARPYDLARALEAYLRDPANFHYQTDVTADVRSQCSGLSTVECFATIRKGYCEYYAGMMTILLREAKIPARVAYGFLPGVRSADGTEVVSAAESHWWVEAFFPRNGWFEFDPTGGGGPGQPQALESGAPVTPPPAAVGSSALNDHETDRIGGRGSGGPAGGGTLPRSGGSGPFAIVALILFLIVIAVALTARRRNRPAPIDPDVAWGGLGRLATRLGFGPRPQQTVYEYAGALGDAFPAARVELATVARAKVEVAYGRQQLGEDRLRIVGDAYRRLRISLLRFGIGRRLARPFRRRRR